MNGLHGILSLIGRRNRLASCAIELEAFTLSNHMKRLFAVLTACAGMTLGAPLAAHAADSLPEDVSAIATDLDALSRLYDRLDKTPPSDLATLGWLQVHERSMPPPILYLYAYKLQANGLTDAALVELARARLGRDLDAAECVQHGARMQTMLQTTDLLEQKMHAEVGRDLKRWLKAIGTVLADSSSRQAMSALWLCGPNNLKTADLASKGRQEQFDFLRSDYEHHLAEEAAPASSTQTILVFPGDTLEKLRAAYPESPVPERMPSRNLAGMAAEEKFQVRLRTKGLWFFLNHDNVVYTVRVEAPFPGSLDVAPVKMSFAEVRRAWGEPTRSFGEHGVTSHIFQRRDAYTTRVDVDQSGQVVTVFLSK